jgi:hypothetical protein
MRIAKHLYKPWLVNKKHNIQQLHMSCKDTHQCLSEKPETKEAHFNLWRSDRGLNSTICQKDFPTSLGSSSSKAKKTKKTMELLKGKKAKEKT